VFKFLEPYKLLIEIGIGIVAFAFAANKVHEFRESDREAGRIEVRVEWAKAEAKAEAAAKLQKEQWDAKAADASKQGDSREQVISGLIVANTRASNSLRDTANAIRDSVPTATIETLRKTTTALTDVFTDCQGRYVEMAGIADRHASDAKTLSDAWPNPPQATSPPPK
jgi:hypothetical protein